MRRAGDRVADARLRSPAKKQRPGRRPLSALAVRRTIGKPSCAPAIVLIGARKCKSRSRPDAEAEGGPAFCGPNAEPSIVPRVLRRAPLTRRIPKVLGNAPPYLTRAKDMATHRGRGIPSPKFGVGSRGAAPAAAPLEAATCRLRRPRSRRGRLAGPTVVSGSPPGPAPSYSQRGEPASVDAGRRRAETSARPAGSATYLRPQRVASVLRCGSPLVDQSTAETANASPKPRVVTSPTALPPRR